MSEPLDMEDIIELSRNEHITAEELDILVTSAMELNAVKEKELKRLKQLLIDLEVRLADLRGL